MSNLSNQELQALIGLAESATERHFEAVVDDDRGWLDNEFGRFYFACLPATFAQAAALAQKSFINAAKPQVVARMALELLEARAALAQRPAVGEAWVSVKDRLPEKIGGYLCLCDDGNQLVCTVNVLGDWTAYPGGRYYGDLAGGGAPQNDRSVTHWQPLPAAPAPQQKGGTEA